MKETKFKQTEIGQIPEDWKVKTMTDVAVIARGGSPRPIQDYLTSSFDGVNWIKIGDVAVGAKYIEKTEERIIPEGVSRSRRVYAGDFLLSNSMSFGRPYILKIDGCIHDGWLVIQNYQDSFNTEFLYYMLNSAQVLNQYYSMAAGSSVLNLNKDIVAKVKVAIPSLEEQERIAEALSDVDGLLRELDAEIAKKRAIKQGAMQELLTGKRRLEGFGGEWIERKFDDFIERFATGLNPRANFKLNDGGVYYYVTIKDFMDGRLYFEGCDRIDEKALELINNRSDLRAGDLLFSSIGRVGDAYVIKEKPKNWNINESVFALRPCKDMDPYFLYYLIKSEDVQNILIENVTGSTLKSIKMGHLKEVVCRYPSDKAEQQAIAKILSDMDADIEALEAKRAKYAAVKQGMMQELLTGKIRLVD